MRIIKLLLAILLLFIVVLGLAFAGLYFFVDANKLKNIIISEAAKRANVQLAIFGDLNWSIYPQMGVKANKIVVNLPGSIKPLATLENVSIALTNFTHINMLASIWPTKFQASGDAQESVTIEKVLINQFHAENVHFLVTFAARKMVVDQLSAETYGGKLLGRVEINSQNQLPVSKMNLSIRDVDIAPLIEDLRGMSPNLKLEGRGTGNLNLTTQGSTQEDFFKYANGGGSLAIRNGAIYGADLNYILKTADALINGGSVSLPGNIQRTQFEQFNSPYLILKNHLYISNLQLIAPIFTATGEGNINLSTEELNIKLHAKTQSLKGQWEVPINIKGTLQKPIINVDQSAIDQIIKPEKLNELQSRVKKEIKTQLPKAKAYLNKLLER